MPLDHLEDAPPDFPIQDQDYALSGRIMLSAIVILFFVVILMVCLHLYARWCLLRARRREIRRARRQRPTRLVFYVDPSNPTSTSTAAAVAGLDPAVLETLPVFVYSGKTHPETLECAVCLSEFEESESGRVLPKCGHSFHIDCIDMWFHSHSTCPLCRSPVEPVPENPRREIPLNEPGSSSGLCAACREEDDLEEGTSTGRRKKIAEMLGVTIEVPSRALSFETESPASEQFRSPMSRMLSFKRILSRERRPPASPTSANCAESGTELDIEQGKGETRELNVDTAVA